MRLLRIKDVIGKTGIARSTIYDLISKRKFPLAVKITEKAVGWHEEDVDQWIMSRRSTT